MKNSTQEKESNKDRDQKQNKTNNNKHRFIKKILAKFKNPKELTLNDFPITKFILNLLKKGFCLIFKFIVLSIILGLVLNLIGKRIFPDLPNRIPTIFIWCSGCVDALDFTFKMVIKAIFSLFTDTPFFLDKKYSNEWSSAIHRFISWLQSL